MRLHLTPDYPNASPDYPNPSSDYPNPSPDYPASPSDQASQFSPSAQSPFEVPCGASYCQDGCVLCIQSDGCGRCLCGQMATVCPAVPVCKVACIVSRPDGCSECSCPKESQLLDSPITRINPYSNPQISLNSGEGLLEEIVEDLQSLAGVPNTLPILKSPS